MRKQKMISFRLTLEEYDRMQILRENYGARTVSDLARLAVHSLVSNGSATSPSDLTVVERLRLVEARILSLNNEVDRLRRHLSNGTTAAVAGG